MAFVKYNTKDNAFSTLLVGISAGATSLGIQAGNGTRFPSSNFIATIVQYTTVGVETSAVVKREKVLVSNNATDTFTITRGFGGDTPVAFNAGDSIYLNHVSAIDVDMQDEITRLESAKANISATVLLTGNQTIAGEKTFDVHPRQDSYTAPTQDVEYSPKKYVDDTTSIIGEIKMWGTSVAPTNYLICDGTSLLRAGTYAPLFAVLGTTYGTADGTHFNIPDFRGRSPIGSGTGTATGATAHTLGATPTSGVGGEEKHTLDITEIPSHTHTFATATSGASTAVATGGQFTSIGNTATTNTSGGGLGHNIMSPNTSVNFIIRY